MFARGTAAALLDAADWGICDDVAAATRGLVGNAADPVSEVSVIVHRDSVEVIVAGGGTYARREVVAARLFHTKVDCELP